MRCNLRLSILIVSITFLFCFNTNSSAETILIEGDVDSLTILAYTKYLDEKPVLLFTEQEQNLKIQNLTNINNFVCKDSNWQDFAVGLCQKTEVREQKTEIRLLEKGVYEIYLDVSEFREEIPEFEIEVDGKLVHSQDSQEGGRKYIKVGETELGGGKHLIKIKNQNAKIKMTKQNLKFILVNKEERQRAEELIWQRINQPGAEVADIFTQNGEFYVP